MNTIFEFDKGKRLITRHCFANKPQRGRVALLNGIANRRAAHEARTHPDEAWCEAIGRAEAWRFEKEGTTEFVEAHCQDLVLHWEWQKDFKENPDCYRTKTLKAPKIWAFAKRQKLDKRMGVFRLRIHHDLDYSFKCLFFDALHDPKTDTWVVPEKKRDDFVSWTTELERQGIPDLVARHRLGDPSVSHRDIRMRTPTRRRSKK